MAAPKIPSVIGPATRNFLEKYVLVVQKAIEDAKSIEKLEAGVVVDGEWKFSDVCTVAEAKAMLRELNIK